MRNIDEYDEVDAPRHYIEQSASVEPIELLRHAPFDIGNALKYIIRAHLKGNELQDLKKAHWYLECAANTFAVNSKPYKAFVKNHGLLLAQYFPGLDFSTCYGFLSYLEVLSRHVERRIFFLGLNDGKQNGTES